MPKITEANTKELAKRLDALMFDTNTRIDTVAGSQAGRRMARALLMLTEMDREVFLNSLELQRGYK